MNDDSETCPEGGVRQDGWRVELEHALSDGLRAAIQQETASSPDQLQAFPAKLGFKPSSTPFPVNQNTQQEGSSTLPHPLS